MKRLLKRLNLSAVSLLLLAASEKYSTGSDKYLLRMLEVPRTEAKERVPHTGPIDQVRFALSPDESTLATTRKTNEVLLWDWKNKEKPGILHRWKTEGAIWSLAFAPDGKTIYAGEQEPTVRILKVGEMPAGYSEQLLIPSDKANYRRINEVRLAADGKVLIAINDLGGKIRFWDLQKREPIDTVDHLSAVACALSPDGKLFASGGFDRTIQIRDTRTAELKKLFKPVRLVADKDLIIMGLAFSPDGQTVASVHQDGTLRLWELETGKQFLTVSLGAELGWSVTFDNTGMYIFAGLPDGKIFRYDTISRRPLPAIEQQKGAVRQLQFLKNGELLSSAEDSRILLLAPFGKATGTTPDANSIAQSLAAADPDQAAQALAQLFQNTKLAWEVVDRYLKPAQYAEDESIEAVLKELDANEFAIRQKAQKDLLKMSYLAEPNLRRALNQKPSLEVRTQLKARLERWTPELVPELARQQRLLAWLMQQKGDQAELKWQQLSQGATDAELTRQASEVLKKQGRQ